MPKIESKIGQTPMQKSNVRNFVVDDPTQEVEEQQYQSQQEPQFKKISPQQYNRMRQMLDGKEQTGGEFKFSSSKNVIPEDLGPTTYSEEDEIMLKMFELNKKAEKTKKESKNKIEVLLGLRKRTATIELDGHEITLRNLKSNETKDVLQSVASKNTGFDKLYLTKHMVVGFAIESIDGQPISSLLGENDNADIRAEIVSNMDPSVVDELYDFYVKEIGNKNIISSNNDPKEVAEEIKK